MPTELQIFGLSTPWYLDAAFVLAASAFLLRDILWLRSLTISANLFLIFGAYFNASGPMWANIYYYLALIAINALHAGWLIYEISLARLTGPESEVYDSAFAELDRVSVRKLLRAGEWLTLPAGDEMAWRGRVAERIFVIAEGEAAVRVGDRMVAALGAGHFVGEISFLSDGPSSADVSAETPLRCLAWRRDALRRLLERDGKLCAVMYAAFGADLSAKLAAHNVTLAEAGPV
jgi:cyclic nucleotide-binding protein